MQVRTLTALSLFLLLFTGILAAQQSSPRISVQGTLKDSDGVSVPNGVQEITFKLFTALSGGTAVWEETANVTTKGGVYSHLLGSVTPLDPADFNQTLFVGVVIDGTELLPRTELAYSPYTLYVDYAGRSGNGSPVGSVMPFAGMHTNVPAGWLLCNGQALTSAQYPELYSVLGTTWGNGSGGINGGGANNFNVPDLRGEFMRGADLGRNVDNGRTLGSSQDQATKAPATAFTGTTNSTGAHTHTNTAIQTPASIAHDGGDFAASACCGTYYGTITVQSSSAGDHSHTVNITGGGDAETRPRNVAMNFIIKY